MKKLNKLFAFALMGAFAAGATACDPEPKEEPKDGPINLSVENGLEFEAEGGSRVVEIGGKNWTATASDESWIDVESEEGRITVVVTENEGDEPRTGSVTVENEEDTKTIAITQSAKVTDGSLAVNCEDELLFAHKGETRIVVVESALPWTIEAEATSFSEEDEEGWFTVTNDESTITIALGGNDQPRIEPIERTGTITVSNGVTSKVIEVKQALGAQTVYLTSSSSVAMLVGGQETIEVVVAPANTTDKRVTWKSSDQTVATVENGVVKALKVGTSNVTATTVDGGFTTTCTVTVVGDWTPGTVRFRSSETWTVGTQEWSDVVMASGAEKTSFMGNFPDGRENGEFGHLFSKHAVHEFGEQLCPESWRVPTNDDFVTLDKALGGLGTIFQSSMDLMNNYFSQWGAEWAGYAYNNYVVAQATWDEAGQRWLGGGVGYWSDDAAGSGLYIVNIDPPSSPLPSISPNSGWSAVNYGFPVRCVR
ncbi:MAG: Ig-like domain-containing protein [Alistipes sp.]|jgi:uncharacterized protein (TIGR02145 family)|nr:Ig-like domain-containing protein [Alistipes sp.]